METKHTPEHSFRKQITDAWTHIRKVDHTIPDEVLDFMKDSALALSGIQNPQKHMSNLQREIDKLEAKLEASILKLTELYHNCECCNETLLNEVPEVIKENTGQ